MKSSFSLSKASLDRLAALLRWITVAIQFSLHFSCFSPLPQRWVRSLDIYCCILPIFASLSCVFWALSSNSGLEKIVLSSKSGFNPWQIGFSRIYFECALIQLKFSNKQNIKLTDTIQELNKTNPVAYLEYECCCSFVDLKWHDLRQIYLVCMALPSYNWFIELQMTPKCGLFPENCKTDGCYLEITRIILVFSKERCFFWKKYPTLPMANHYQMQHNWDKPFKKKGTEGYD